MLRRIVGPLLLAVLQGAFSLGAAMYQKPDWRWWASIVGTATLGVVFAALVTIAAEKGHRAKMKLDVENILQAAMIELSTEVGLEPQDISLRAFKVSRSASTFWLQKEQRSIGVIRQRRGVPPLTIRWREGVGVIGRCWKTKHEVQRIPLSGLAELSQADWGKLDPDARMGFSWEQWLSLRERYHGLVAYPIVEQRGYPGRYRYWGCVALGAFAEEAWVKMHRERRDATNAQLGNAAASILGALKA